MDKKSNQIMNEGMFTLTGKKNGCRCTANTLYPGGYCRHHDKSQFGGIKLSTRPEVVNEIIRGLTAAGVKENKIVVCDRLVYHLIKAGFPRNQGSSGVHCYGTEPTAGYDKKIYCESLGDEYSLRQDDGAQSLFSTIVTQHVTAIINYTRYEGSRYCRSDFMPEESGFLSH